MKQLTPFIPIVAAELELFMTEKQQAHETSIGWNADLLQRLKPFVSGGKLLRGSTLCFSYALCSDHDPSPAVLRCAVALELTHSALLVHDDIMDQDATRRGQPSLYAQYQASGRQQKLADSDHYGESMAICGGDTLFFMAYELLGNLGVNPAIARSLNQLFARQLAQVCTGQMQDMHLQARTAMPTKNEIYQLMEAKTAAYTVALPLVMGAILAGQDSATLKNLQALGVAAGTIFQIRDDELGLLSTVAELGKPIGSDIREGKKTLIYYYLLKKANSQDKAYLQTVFANKQASAQDIARVQALAKTYGIPDLLAHDIAQLQHTAEQHIAQLSVHEAGKNDLRELVAFCAQRHA